MAKWIETATKEQGVSKDQYMRDSVWPSAALKKLTGNSIQVSEEDINKGFDANYGERVRCRAIVLPNMRKAQEVWGKARQNTSMDYFGDLAEEYSVEPSSKSLRGEVPPIRRYGGQPQLEDVAFELQPGELSGIIQLGDKFVILKCEGRTKPVEVNPQEVQRYSRIGHLRKEAPHGDEREVRRNPHQSADRQLPRRHVASARPRKGRTGPSQDAAGRGRAADLRRYAKRANWAGSDRRLY